MPPASHIKSRRPVKGQKLDTTPRIRAFKFSTKNKSDAAFRDRLVTLKKKFGVKFPFAVNAKLTPRRKAAISRRVGKVVEFLNPENGFQFVPLTPAVIRKVAGRRQVSKEQRTAKGIFVPVAKGAKKRTRIRITKIGEIETTTGKFTSKNKIYRSVDIVRDPARVIRDAEKLGAESIFVSIKGHRGKTAHKIQKSGEKRQYSLKAFMRYMTEQIVPDIEDAQDDDESGSAFRNYFGVEFVSYRWSKSRSGGKKTKTKNRK